MHTRKQITRFLVGSKKVRGVKSFPSSSVDGVEGNDAVCELFKSKYEELYNSVSFEQTDIDVLRDDVCSMVHESCLAGLCYDNHNVTFHDVSHAAKKLKAGKSDSNDCLTSDHFINAPDDLYVHIALLLNAMLVHGNSPHDMLMSVLVPIPKNAKKSLRDSTNYRSIAISSIVGKIFDNIVLQKHCDVLSSADLQFGFKPGFSTTQCTFVLEEVIDYYVQQNSMVCVVLLDASKAFDRVNFVKLFRLLMDRGLCPLVVKLLLSMYISQSMFVRWQGFRSEPFNCTNGVKQGGVLSPVLFCVYTDALLNALKKCKVGCHIHNLYAGALSYADDVTLLAPSFTAMREMLKVCEIFSENFDVLFNSSKSVSLVFNSPVVNTIDLTLHGEVIPRKSSAIHLGNYIGLGATQSNMKKAMNDLCTRCNYVRNTFKFCRFSEKCLLFSTFCTSFYGSSLLDIAASDTLYTCWRKCIRSLLGLNVRTHSALIPHIIGKVDLKIDLLSRFFCFWQSCMTSKSSVVRACIQNCLSSSTNVSKNLKIFMSYLNINVEMLNDLYDSQNVREMMKKKWRDNCELHDIITSTAIVELIQMRSVVMQSFFNAEELSHLINHLCID